MHVLLNRFPHADVFLRVMTKGEIAHNETMFSTQSNNDTLHSFALCFKRRMYATA